MLDDLVELVIASLSMPDGDPLRLVSQWRANESSRRLPILLMADDSELPRLAKGLDLGANDYLIRPVDRNELLARVRTQIRRKRLQERLRENYQPQPVAGADRRTDRALQSPLRLCPSERGAAADAGGRQSRPR